MRPGPFVSISQELVVMEESPRPERKKDFLRTLMWWKTEVVSRKLVTRRNARMMHLHDDLHTLHNISIGNGIAQYSYTTIHISQFIQCLVLMDRLISLTDICIPFIHIKRCKTVQLIYSAYSSERNTPRKSKHPPTALTPRRV